MRHQYHHVSTVETKLQKVAASGNNGKEAKEMLQVFKEHGTDMSKPRLKVVVPRGEMLRLVYDAIVDNPDLSGSIRAKMKKALRDAVEDAHKGIRFTG